MSKQILITGASRGIGYETAKYLAEQECQVIVAARSKEKLQALAGEYPDYITAISMDITDEENHQKLVDYLHQTGRKLDGIIHNAGLLINKPFKELTKDDWQQQLDVNVTAPALLTKNLLPYLDNKSHVLNIGSMGGFQGSAKFPGLTGYSVAKGGLSILTECLGTELADEQISCNCLCLGAVQTEMLENAFPGMVAPVDPESMGKYVGDFVLSGHQFYNGKVLPVSLMDPS